ncbi:MAG: N-methyl-L-tryptophan oxidase [Hyphomicrobiales bacterium]
MAQYDAIVIGAGAMGGAALYQVGRRGARVLGIECLTPGHEGGSSHGAKRVIRISYYEHPSYVPLVRAASTLWRELEGVSGQKLLHTTGIIEIGRPDCELIQGTLASARHHHLQHQALDAAEVMRRIPAFKLPDDFIGVWQPDGGYLEAGAGIKAHIDLALAAGAELHTNEIVRAVEPRGTGVRVTTDRGTYDAKTAIVAAGAWAKTFFPDLPLRVTRQVLGWFKPRDPAPFAQGKFPVFMLESEHGIHYGFPLDDAGLKISKHFHRNETADPGTCERAVSAADENAIRAGIAGYLPDANGPLLEAKTCLYTMTPDGDFIIDQIPSCPQIILASPCSGHGFKFAPVVGEILADLAMEGTTGHDISRFRLARFN